MNDAKESVGLNISPAPELDRKLDNERLRISVDLWLGVKLNRINNCVCSTDIEDSVRIIIFTGAETSTNMLTAQQSKIKSNGL